jgi:hypothetical protein
MRGRSATQVVSANFISLPAAAGGVTTDLLDIAPVLLLLSLVIGGVAVASIMIGGAELPEREEERRPQEAHT